MPPEMSDEALAARTQRGELAAFDQIARRYQTILLRFVRRNFTNLPDAEDVVQDTFVKAFQNIRHYRAAWPFKTWLFTLAFRVAIGHTRRERRVLRLARSHRNDPGGPTVTDIVVRRDEARNLWEAAAQVLTPTQFRALWLLYAEDLGRAQIAAIIGKSRPTTKLILYRATRRMQEYFAPTPPGAARLPNGPVLQGVSV